MFFQARQRSKLLFYMKTVLPGKTRGVLFSLAGPSNKKTVADPLAITLSESPCLYSCVPVEYPPGRKQRLKEKALLQLESLHRVKIAEGQKVASGVCE
jgi:hypothetical protein